MKGQGTDTFLEDGICWHQCLFNKLSCPAQGVAGLVGRNTENQLKRWRSLMNNFNKSGTSTASDVQLPV